jgi:hypothetical protein
VLCFLPVIDVLVVVLVLILVVADDPQDLDGAEGGSQPPPGRLLAGIPLATDSDGYRSGG